MRFSSPYFVTSVREKKMKIRERKVPDNCRVRNLNSRSLLGCNPLRFDDHLHMSPHVKVSRIPESVHWNPEFQHKESGIQVLLASEQALRGALAVWLWGGKRKENLQLRLWNLNSTSNSPVAPVDRAVRFRQSARSGNERECKQTLKNTCQGY